MSHNLSYEQMDIYLSDPSISNKQVILSWIHPLKLIPHINSFQMFKTHSGIYLTDNVVERVNDLILKNEILRTIIVNKYQTVLTYTPIQLQIYNIEQDQVDPPIKEDMSRPVLWKVCYNDTYLYRLDIHHCFLDGISKTILLKQILNGVPSVELQYLDWCIYERTYIPKVKFDEVSSYYELDLPYDRLSVSKICYSSSIIQHLSLNEIKDVISKYRVSPYILVLSILSIVFHFITRQDHIVLAGAVHNRNISPYQYIIGLFSKLVYYCISFKPNLLVSDVISHFNTNVLNRTLEQKYIENDKRLSRCIVDLTSKTMDYQIKEEYVPKYDLHIYLALSNWEIRYRYNTSLFDKHTIIMIRSICQQIIPLILNSQTPISEWLYTFEYPFPLYHQLKEI
jgi:hypothetical protein